MRISEAAFDLVVREEDSDAQYYEKFYEGFSWPKGASGPTVAIGYDLGYVTRPEMANAFSGIVSDATISAMLPACGLRGPAAAAFVKAHAHDIAITWDQAISEFKSVEVPKWEMAVVKALPNTDLLAPDSFGALFSLCYNRGTGGFRDPSPRDHEMRQIYQAMTDKAFSKIPMFFLSMRRLWPYGSDLWHRRSHEAALFMQGLGET